MEVNCHWGPIAWGEIVKLYPFQLHGNVREGFRVKFNYETMWSYQIFINVTEKEKIDF